MGKLRGIFTILENRNSKLDALRGISILLVLTTHGLFNLKFLGLHILLPKENLAILQSNGYLGVSIFFVVSGFLITRSLLNKGEDSDQKEKAVDIIVDVPKFYAKRFARIFPPLVFLFFITFIFSISRLDFFGQFDLDGLHVFFLAMVHAFTFTYNNFYFFGPGGKVEGLSHLVPLWSLSIEEVFYLIWPVLILVFRKRRIILVVLLLLFFYSVLYRLEYGSGALYSYFGCVDMLTIGCFVALTQESNAVQKFLRFSRIGLIGTSLLLFYFLVSFDIHTNYVIAPSLVGLTSGLFILFASMEKTTLKSKVGILQLLVPLRLLGFLSYELYLFHLIFWGLFYKFDVTQGTAWLSTLVPLTVAIFVCLIMHLYMFEPARKITYEFLKGK